MYCSDNSRNLGLNYVNCFPPHECLSSESSRCRMRLDCLALKRPWVVMRRADRCGRSTCKSSYNLSCTIHFDPAKC